MSSEFDFISWIRKQQKPGPLVRLGIGDDLAVLNWAKEDLLLVGVDQVLDGVHFDSAVHSPRAIGRKAMNRNESIRSTDEIEQEERTRKRMDVIREFIEAKSRRVKL